MEYRRAGVLRRLTCRLLVVTPLALFAACVQVKPRSSLAVEDIRLNGRRLSFSLTNHGHTRITACSLDIETGSNTGPSVKWTTDWYSNTTPFNGAPLQPRESRNETISAPRSAVSPPRVSVAAVVFDDGSASGDPARIDAIFQRRIRDREALSRLFEHYASALDLQSTVDIGNLPSVVGGLSMDQRRLALTRVRTALDAISGGDVPVLVSDLRKALNAARPEADGDIRVLLRLSTLYEAALRHSRRGG